MLTKTKNPKSFTVEERYRYPRGIQIKTIKERRFDLSFNARRLNREVYPLELSEGWYVLDAIKMPDEVIVSFGIPSNLA